LKQRLLGLPIDAEISASPAREARGTHRDTNAPKVVFFGNAASASVVSRKHW
jgi:hypothetical protein